MDFSKVQNLMDEAVREHDVVGSDIAVTYKGEPVYRYHNGTRDDERSIPVQGDELYFLYSATKVITCTVALQLLEQGKLRLDDPVSKYIPEYGTLSILPQKSSSDTSGGVVQATHVCNHGTYFYETLHPAIRDAVYEILSIR